MESAMETTGGRGGGLTEAKEEENEETRGEEGDEGSGLSSAQKQVLERCLQALKVSKNDSHTLAALLLVTRVVPAQQLDRVTLRRVFEAVGLNLPARLLLTATRGGVGGGEGEAFPPEQLVSLGAALLAALCTDTDMTEKPELLSIVPTILKILSQGINTRTEDGNSTTKPHQPNTQTESSGKLEASVALDCFQILSCVCSAPLGPARLLKAGAVPALCRAAAREQTLAKEKGIPLLGRLLSGKTKDQAWRENPRELFALLSRITEEFTNVSEVTRLGSCGALAQFLPPADGPMDDEDRVQLKAVAGQIWTVLRPMLQSKLTPAHTGPALVLAACLLDLCGWEEVGPPRFCCLLVNRACVEVRMGLEEPPGTEISAETKETITGCYRIMEAAMEQACTASETPPTTSEIPPPQGSSQTPPPQASTSGLSLQQSRQVLMVVQEAFSAVIYNLQQVPESSYSDPFVFASFRSLCSFLAEETSCLKEEVTSLLPFLIGYCRSHMSGRGTELCDWLETMTVKGGATGAEPLRFLLPALCHLSAEDKPRKILLSLEVPELLVSFLQQNWRNIKSREAEGEAETERERDRGRQREGGEHERKRQREAESERDPGLETACSALLNFIVTEPQRVRSDPCFQALETLLSEALPVVMTTPSLVVLSSNFCSLSLMMIRLKDKQTDPGDSSEQRLFTCCLHFLCGVLSPPGPPSSGPSPNPPSGPSPSGPSPCWDELSDLFLLSLQALTSCFQTQVWTRPLVRQTWLRPTLRVLGQSSAPPEVLQALQEALSVLGQTCPQCRDEIQTVEVKTSSPSSSSSWR